MAEIRSIDTGIKWAGGAGSVGGATQREAGERFATIVAKREGALPPSASRERPRASAPNNAQPP